MSMIFTSKMFDVSSTFGGKVNKNSKQSLLAIEYYKKLCTKFHTQNNTILINQLKNENFYIFLDIYSLKEIQLISKIISNHFYFKTLIITPNDPNKLNQSKASNKSRSQDKQDKVQSEKDLKEIEKEQKEAAKVFKQKIDFIMGSLTKHLKSSKDILEIRFINLSFSLEHSKIISNSMKLNESINVFTFNNCKFNSTQNLDTILECLLTHEKIEFMELPNNQLNDKCANIISRIISRQTQLRDQIIWMYGLRNERPLNNDLSRGLISINLSNNNLTSSCVEQIVNALSYDNYIRKLNLRENQICANGCHLFNKLLKSNTSILNIDLRKNPGFSKHYERKIYFKLARNIQNTVSKLNLTRDEFLSQFSKIICMDYFNSEINPKSNFLI